MLVIFKKNSFPHYVFYRHLFKSFWEGRYIDKAGKRAQRGDTGQIRAAEASVLTLVSGACGYTIAMPGFGAVLLCLPLDPWGGRATLFQPAVSILPEMFSPSLLGTCISRIWLSSSAMCLAVQPRQQGGNSFVVTRF